MNIMADRITEKKFIEDIDNYIKHAKPEVKLQIMFNFAKLKMDHGKYKKSIEDDNKGNNEEETNSLLQEAKDKIGETPIKKDK